MAAVTLVTGTRRIHSGCANFSQKYPWQGWHDISSNTTSAAARFHGRQCAIFDEPKITTLGVPTAAAMCAIPLSLPTNTCDLAASAVTSGSDKSNDTISTEASEDKLSMISVS